jgi:diacylglycerol kinase family enzyme
MRRRLRAGAHLPHPRIRQHAGTRFDVRAARRLPLEVDGEAHPRVSTVGVEVLPAAYAMCL